MPKNVLVPNQRLGQTAVDLDADLAAKYGARLVDRRDPPRQSTSTKHGGL